MPIVVATSSTDGFVTDDGSDQDAAEDLPRIPLSAVDVYLAVVAKLPGQGERRNDRLDGRREFRFKVASD